jgi:beta-N-acetylhexosaminidase
VAALALTGCGTAGTDGGPSAAAEPTTAPTPDCTPGPLERRAAAVLMVGLPGATTGDDPLVAEVVDLGVSGVFVNHDNVVSETQVRSLVSGIRERAGGPLLVSTDEESGRVSNTRKIVGPGPSPRRMTTQMTPTQVRAFANDIGTKLADVGIDMDLAPSLDLDDGPSGGIIGDRSFSADVQDATDYGLAFTRGLADAGVVPTVKHFPGQGRSRTDTHTEGELVDASLDDLRETDLVPFQTAIDQGVPVIMLNHLSYSALDPDLPASMSPRAYALLRAMGFDGVAVTDSIGMGAIYPRWDFPDAAVTAVAAGADAVLATDGRQATRMRDALVAAVRDGGLDEDRLNEAAARTVALVGGDAEGLTCQDKVAPELQPDPATAPDPAAP